MLREVPSLEFYERQKRRLAKKVYDDEHGITMSLEDYHESLEYTKKELKKTKNPKRKVFLKNQKERDEKAIKEFEPQWVSYVQVKRFVNDTDRLLSHLAKECQRRKLSVLRTADLDYIFNRKEKSYFEDLVFRMSQPKNTMKKHKESKLIKYFAWGVILLAVLSLIGAILGLI